MKKYLSILMVAVLVVFASCSSDDDNDKAVYTVTFETDGGTPVPSVQRVEEGSTATAPSTNPAKAGYAFVFWHVSGTATAYNFQTPVNRDITLQAKWQEEATAEYWQVTWNLNGGAWPSGDNHATQVLKGGTLAEPAEPTKSGSTFEGWYKESALTNKVTFPYDVSNVTGDFTLYAKWKTEGSTGNPEEYTMFASISALKSWLESQPNNTAETAYKVGLRDVNLDSGNNWGDLGICISEVRKNVDLDLRSCTSTAIPDGYRERIPRPDQIITYKTYGVFVDCDYLIAIKLPKGLKTIGDYAFFECGRLTSVVLPEGLTAINTRAFDSCRLTSITLPEGLKVIEYGAFNSNNFTSINIPGSVSELGAYAFDFCFDLTSVTLNDGLKIIGTSTFEHCESLTSIQIPVSVTSIEGSAFQNCTSLTEVVMLSATPPSMGDHVFGYTVANYKIKVPAASLNTYKTANGWKDYADRIVANTN